MESSGTKVFMNGQVEESQNRSDEFQEIFFTRYFLGGLFFGVN